ncbi:MAG TPA: ABC transporter substrate-binding protein [Chloroflexota bacterium]|nr:ABC transporter substrate-binding protein [Chloroflexota bacterium]
MGRRLLGLGIVALASVLVGSLGAAAVAPSSAAAPAAAPARQTTTLRVAYLPIAGNMDVLLARDQGWFTEEGLAVDLTAMAGGAEILPALIGGSLDLGTLNVVTHILAEDQGFRARAVAGVQVERRGLPPIHGIVVRADSPIQSGRDLEGKTMATNTLNNIDHIMQQVWVRQQGGDPSRVNFVEVPFPQQPAALAQSRVDAIGPAEPFVTIAVDQGGRMLAAHYLDVNDVTLLAYYGATDDWLGRNADLAQRFHRVIQRADDFLFGNPDELHAAAVRYLNMDPAVAARIGYGENTPRVDPAGIQWWIDTVRSFNLTSNQLNPQDFIYETVR